MDKHELINNDDEEKENQENAEDSSIAEINNEPVEEEVQSVTPNEVESETEESTKENIDQKVEDSSPDLDEDKPKHKETPRWLKKGLFYLLSIVLLLLIGYLISFFTTTLPNSKTIQSLSSQLSEKDTALTDLQNQYDQATSNLQTMHTSLQQMKSDLDSLQAESQQATSNQAFNLNLVNLKYEIGIARMSIINQDTLSARQALSLANNHFEAIRTNLDAEISSGIQDRLLNIQKLITTNTTKAADELRTLAENLDRIPLK